MPKIADLTAEQRVQHQAVLKVAWHNLTTVIDSIQTLDNSSYDELLEYLDRSLETLENKQVILRKAGETTDVKG